MLLTCAFHSFGCKALKLFRVLQYFGPFSTLGGNFLMREMRVLLDSLKLFLWGFVNVNTFA